MTIEFADLVVLGGGCAGLSLATRLASSGNNKLKVVVLESRSSYEHDRAWCMFGDATTAGRADVQHTWPAMRVASSGVSVLFNCTAAPYQMVHSGKFYQQAQATLAQSKLIDLRLGVHLSDQPQKRDNVWQICSDAGTIASRLVIDTRPAIAPVRGGARLWQSFYGQEIQCVSDCFDPACGDLMDFSAAGSCAGVDALGGAVCFVYVLPTTARQALVEFTVFGPDPLGPEQLRGLLKHALAQRTGGARFAVRRSEHGVLPMGLTSAIRGTALPDPTYVFAGVTAGGARPSSGYAFARIQRWAAQCAQSLAVNGLPVGHLNDGWVLRAMDALFLRLVRAHPRAAPDLFAALFASASPQSVIRFLNDSGSRVDTFRVVRALFPGPLLRALLRRKPGRDQALVPVARPTL